jgi:hypothetical protein
MSDDPFRGIDAYASPYSDEEREYAYRARVEKIEGQIRLDEVLELIEEEEPERDFTRHDLAGFGPDEDEVPDGVD